MATMIFSADATKSIALILDQICGAIREGLEDRKNSKDKVADQEEVAEKVTSESDSHRIEETKE